MKKFLSIVLSILMVVTMLPMAVMPASAAYDYDETAKISFKITNLVREWKGETEELGEYGSGFYEQSLTKVADGKYKYTYKAALSIGGGTWWSDPKTVTFDGVDCESDYYKTFDFTESTSVGGYTMTWTYTLEVKRYKGHTYSAWSDNGDGTHTRTCVINSAHKEIASHNYAAATCSAPETCKNCGATQGESVADAHGWNAATCVLPQTCKYCGITQGEVLGHNMVAATFGKPAACSRCGATDINISVLEAALINTNVNLPSKAIKDDNAGYIDITWSVVDAGSTGATINGKTLKAFYSGEAVIRATIESGSKDFTILFKSSENIDISLGSVTVSQKDDSTLTVAYAGFEGGSKDYMVGEPIQITGTTTSNYVEVSSGAVTVILNNVSISRDGYCFRVNGGATADLTLVGSNALSTVTSSYAALSVPENATVIIGGEGTLTAIATNASAAIGSGYFDDGTGTIVINGGTIIAKNTYNTGSAGAGIGGGNKKNGGNIIINGGVVTATGGAYAAGIGGGNYGNGGQITINSGIVTATGGESAAGIGGGMDEFSRSNHGDGGQITITGGSVIAKGGDYRNYYSGAGIGGGHNGNGGTVVITGGNIKATAGSSYAEAIGKGNKGESSGTIKDENGNDLSLQTITLSGAAENTAVTATDGITYGLTDVKTVDTNKLYFYLPADTAATSITAGGTVYDCVVGLTYYPGHSYLEATCSTAKTCTTCGLTEGEALGHNMVDGICIVCRLDENGVHHIYTADQLMDFAVIVNEGYKDADAVLMADIDLSGYDWDIICETGLYYNGYGDDLGYAGTFDGNGHIIKNISVKSSTTIDASCGLFGTVSGTIKNLGIEGFTFVDGGKDIRTGAIVGQLITTNGRVENCYVKNATIKPGEHVTGGIAGCVYDGTIENCYVVESDINGTSNRYGYIVGDSRGDKGTTDRPGTVKNCYTDNSTIRSNNVGNITDCATKSASAFASGEVTYLLNGKKSDGELVWGQLIGTDSYPVFGGETVYYNETNGYYNILHTCDFTGEWKYDTEKHWKECTVDGCSETSEEAEHSYTYGKCDCGYECPHEDTYNNLIRPVQNADGTWGKGKIVKICNTCGNSSLVQEVERDHEGYKVFDETAAELEAILNSGKMTDTWKNDYTNSLNGLRNSAYYQVYTEIETAIPSMTESLKSIIAAIEAGIADGTMIKADFTYMTSLFDEINALIDNDPNKLIPSESGRFQGIYYGYYMSCKDDGNHSQADYDQNMAGNNWEGQIEAILAGVKDGTALKADYTEIDEAIAALDEKLADVNLTDEAKAELEELKAQLEEMKKDPLSSKADVEELMKAVEELEAGVEDGTIVLVDAYKIFDEYDIARSDDLEEKYGREKVDEVFFKIHIKNPEVIDSIWEYVDSITGTVAETADEIEEIKRMFDNLYEGVERCIIGTHNVEEYEVISPAKCGANAIESGTCTFCVDVLTREVENSALTHSFTKYEETEAPKCGVSGKEVAYCDNGCGEADEKEIEALTHSFTKYEVTEEAKCGIEGKKVAVCDHGCGETDEKAIEALEHLFVDYIYNEDATCTADGTKTAECIYGCGETDTVTAEDTMLDHADEDGDKICDDCETEIKDVCPDCGGPAHEETGVPQYICMLITLIKLVVALVKALQSVA